jgi:hypothetical protein
MIAMLHGLMLMQDQKAGLFATVAREGKNPLGRAVKVIYPDSIF